MRRRSILVDVTPAWFACRTPDAQRFIWSRCLTVAAQAELWHGLTHEQRIALVAALRVAAAEENNDGVQDDGRCSRMAPAPR